MLFTPKTTTENIETKDDRQYVTPKIYNTVCQTKDGRQLTICLAKDDRQYSKQKTTENISDQSD